LSDFWYAFVAYSSRYDCLKSAYLVLHMNSGSTCVLNFQTVFISIYLHLLPHLVILFSIFPTSPHGPNFVIRSSRYGFLKFAWPFMPQNLWLSVFFFFIYVIFYLHVLSRDLCHCIPLYDTFPTRYQGRHADTYNRSYDHLKVSAQLLLIVPMG
jgi:hypothetical protein